MFDDYPNLRPWKGAAEILAKDDSWGTLYDLEQLSKNKVKVSAVTYVLHNAKSYRHKTLTTNFNIDISTTCMWTLILHKRRHRRPRTRSSISPIS